MKLDETYRFAAEHLDQDTDKLLLASKKYPEIDMRIAVTQILSRRAIKEKLPEWYNNSDIRYPAKLATEQCSSEITAKYKASLAIGSTLCDLTGGLGVDTTAFSKVVSKVYYYERFAEYCTAAEHNFKVLQCNNITVHNQDFRDNIDNIHADTIYVDPARRGSKSERLFSLNEYEPNIIELKERLLAQSSRLIVKVSPMADITAICTDLPEIYEIHIVSVKNECKELLLIAQNEIATDRKIVTINFKTPDSYEKFEFNLQEESSSNTIYASQIGKFIYEPNASIMKSGGFKCLANHYNAHQIGRNSHLYTSDNPISAFPGRGFKVEKVIDFSSKWLKSAKKEYPKANIAVRNFPLTVAEIRKASKIGDGGDVYIFATTISEDKKVIIVTTKE